MHARSSTGFYRFGAAANAAAGKASSPTTARPATARSVERQRRARSSVDPDAKKVGRVIEQGDDTAAPHMPPFKNTLSEQQIKNVAAYVTTKIRSRRVVVAMRRRGPGATTTRGVDRREESFDA